uniref:Uncharacterized protein n=1 Tax=Strigamia maritima TaxID=126957 RepID=T1IQ25_STRMM
MPDFPHQASSEGFSSQLEIFSLSPIQVTIDSNYWAEFHPISAIANNQPLEFVVHGNAEEYLDLRDTFLLLNVKLEIMLNDRLVSASDANYAYRSYLDTILNFSEDAKDSYQMAALYYKDHGGTFEVNNPIDVKARSEYGLVKRFGRLMGSGDRGCLQMFSKLHADLFNQSHLLINGVTMKLRLTRSKDSFSLISSEDYADYVMLVTTVYLDVCSNPNLYSFAWDHILCLRNHRPHDDKHTDIGFMSESRAKLCQANLGSKPAQQGHLRPICIIFHASYAGEAQARGSAHLELNHGTVFATTTVCLSRGRPIDVHVTSVTQATLYVKKICEQMTQNLPLGGNWNLVVNQTTAVQRKPPNTPSVLLAHTQAIAQKNAVYPILRTEVKTFTIPTGYRNANIDQAYIGQFPSRLIL